MGQITANRVSTGGGSGGEQQRWQKDNLAQSAAWAAGGLSISLTQVPVDEDGIFVLSEGMLLNTSDYTYNSGTNSIVIGFPADPATDTDDGVWNFQIRYPYLLP